jgi:hypothetical protein
MRRQSGPNSRAGFRLPSARFHGREREAAGELGALPLLAGGHGALGLVM